MPDTSNTSRERELVMYCRQWCSDCRRAREWLDSHGIAYREIDVSLDENAREHAAGLNEGRLHTPTFVLGDGVCVDFKPDRLSELLGIRAPDSQEDV